MTNRFLLLAFLLFAARTCFSQEITRQDADSIIKALNNTKQRVDRVDMLLNLAQFHIFKPGEEKTDFDSAMLYLKEAAVLNRSVKSPEASGYLLLTESFMAREKGQRDEAKKITEKAVGILETGKNNSVNITNMKQIAGKSFDVIKQINAGVLNVGYAEAGPVDGPVVILLHGWPYDIHSFIDVAPLLEAKGYRVIMPYLRGYGTTKFLSGETFRNGQQAVIAVDVINLMDALKINKAIIAGFDWGARTVNILAALWPERCKAMVSVSGYLIGSQEANKMPLPPKAELEWWYQYYFATERGRAGYEKYTREFAKLIWKIASPKWNFDDVTFDRTAASFDNPDHVAIVIHNYRWRLSLAAGDSQYDNLEKRLAEGPVISVPTITLEGDANGAPHPDEALYRRKFSGKHLHRTIKGGIGHNLPQEAPKAFANAIIEADDFSK